MAVLQKKHTYRQIIMILQQSIIQCSKGKALSDYQLPSQPKKYNYTIQIAIEEQTEIGWNNVLKGWLLKRWAKVQDEYYEERSKTDKRINRNITMGLHGVKQ